MRYLTFSRLEDLLDFLVACEYGETPLGAARERPYQWVHLDAGTAGKPVYGIEYPEDVAPVSDGAGGEPPLFRGGIFVREGALGRRLHLNDFLRGLPIRPWHSPPLDTVGVTVVWDPAHSHYTPKDAGAVLVRVWESLPRGNGGEIRIFEGRFPGQGNDVFVLTLNGLSEHVRVSDIRKHVPQEAGFAVYLPAWRDRNCFLHVLWDFEYPAAREFALLFDEERENGDGIHVCDPELTNKLEIAGEHGWFPAKFRRVVAQERTVASERTNFLIGADRITGVDFRSDTPPALLARSGTATHLPKIDVRLRLFPPHRDQGEAIEARVAKLERELEALRRRMMAQAAAAEHRYNVVYRFDSGADGRLSPMFELFLDRPRSELARFLYHAERADGGVQHFVASRFSMSRLEARLVAADGIYLQDLRWQDWDLSLFLPLDARLNLEINEAEMAREVAAKLASATPGVEHLLADPEAEPKANPEADRAAEKVRSEAGRRLVLRPLQFGQQLDEAVLLLNDAQTRSATTAGLASANLQAQVDLYAVVAGKDTVELHERLLALTAEITTGIEKRWEEVRQAGNEAELRIAVVELLLKHTAKAYEPPAKTWQEFVDRVVTIDNEIADAFVQAAQEWTAAEEKRTERLAQLERNHESFVTKIAEERVRIQARADELRTREKSAGEALRNLEAERAKLLQCENAVAEKYRAVRDARLAVDQQIAAIDAKRKAIDEETQLLQARQAEEVRKQTELEQAQVNLDELKLLVTKLETDNASAEASITRGVEAAVKRLAIPAEKAGEALSAAEQKVESLRTAVAGLASVRARFEEAKTRHDPLAAQLKALTDLEAETMPLNNESDAIERRLFGSARSPALRGLLYTLRLRAHRAASRKAAVLVIRARKLGVAQDAAERVTRAVDALERAMRDA